ncbi:hypothetical protein F5Y04DRAFT_262948 [Hypomontagnella monticulosa]|nr:hypothetical protein F5Y04DRAFT_262948 [Hypomontagnella monticulosa]
MARDQCKHHCEPPHSISNYPGRPVEIPYTTAWTWSVIAGCLRLLDRHPKLFVETLGNDNTPAVQTPIFISHSGEDWNRAFLLWRWFSRRRNARRFQTSGKKRPSGNNNSKSCVLSWYSDDAAIYRDSTQKTEEREEVKFQTFAMRIRPMVETSGLDNDTRSESYDAYCSLNADQQRDFALIHTQAIEKFRVQLYTDDTSTGRIDALPKMDRERQDMLCNLLRQRIGKVNQTHIPIARQKPIQW